MISRVSLARLAPAAACLLGGLLASQTAFAGSNPNVGVSVNINQPGFYGRVDIGNQPAPALVYQQPVIIQQTPTAVYQRPIYMRVPPGHYQAWARHCGYYRACGQPVYFVRDGGPRGYDDRRGGDWWGREGGRDGGRDWGRHHDHHHHGHGHWGHHRD